MNTQLPNTELKPVISLKYGPVFPPRKTETLWNYRLNRGQFAIAKRITGGSTQYRDIDGSVFTDSDCDPAQHEPVSGLSDSELSLLLEIAKADPVEAIALFKLLPAECKPQLQKALRSLSAEERRALKDAAQGIEESNAPKMGCCTVHSVLSEPQWLLPQYKAVYVGRGSRSQQLSASPLANLSPMLRKSQSERQKIVNDEVERLVRCLEVRKGNAWDELRRLSIRVQNGEHLRLTYEYEQGPNHAEAIALVIQALAKQQSVESIAEKLRALLPAEQSQLF